LSQADSPINFLTGISIERIEFYLKLYSEDYKYENWTYNKDDIPYFKNAISWFKESRNALETRESIDNFIKTNSSLNSKEPSDIQKSKIEVIHLIDDIVKLYQNLDQLEKDLESYPFNYAIKWIMPFLLSLFLSIQTTKISVELRGFRE